MKDIKKKKKTKKQAQAFLTSKTLFFSPLFFLVPSFILEGTFIANLKHRKRGFIMEISTLAITALAGASL